MNIQNILQLVMLHIGTAKICDEPNNDVADCFTNEGISIWPLPESYMLGASNFHPACTVRNATSLVDCYSNIINTCTDYRDYNPGMMDNATFLSHLVGLCMNKNIFKEGMECVGVKQQVWNAYTNQNCISNSLQSHVWDAYIEMTTWPWSRYCSEMSAGIECSITRALEFGCSEQFYDYLRYSAFIRLPVECRDPNSTNFKWLDMYREIPDSFEPVSGHSPSINFKMHFTPMLMCLVQLMAALK